MIQISERKNNCFLPIGKDSEGLQLKIVMKKTTFEETQLHNIVKNAEINGYKKVMSDKNRLQFHLMPPVGWMNDPNGLCQWKGIYHVFFQYSPEDANGMGLKAWGHYTSPNLLQWKKEETTFLPDQTFDKDGVYSGSACICEETMYLFYTGNTKEEGKHDYTTSGRGANTVMAGSQDGLHFSEKKCIMTNRDYPDDYTCHVRDPKVWVQDNRFYMVQGGRKYGMDRDCREQDYGAILLFEGEDAEHFHVTKEITTKQPLGYMWECPDYFELDGKRVLSFSPQGVEAETYRFQNIYQSGYLLLEKNPNTWEKTEYADGENFCEWDMGFDFYAPQTFLSEDGRRILIGWAGIPDAEYDNIPTIQKGWQHALTFPRELSVKNGRIYQNPVKELHMLRKKEKEFPSNSPILMEENTFELLIKRKNHPEDFSVTISDGKEVIWIRFEKEMVGNVLSLSFSEKCGRGREIRKMKLETLDTLAILLDTSMIEIYINGGEAVCTSRFYMEGETRSVMIEGTAKNKVWYLERFQMEG